MLRSILWVTGLLFVLFILPALMHMAVWAAQDLPRSWRHADWSSAGVLPAKPDPATSGIWIMSARTGGLKGALATHSWIVTKAKGDGFYNRYDVVGWGSPVRRNGYPADGRWYSNPPAVHHHLDGEEAERLIPKVEAAIAGYRWRQYGDYRIWPGPNSNTFVASIAQAVPGIAVPVPATAVGRDFPADGRWFGRHEDGSLFATLGGYAGIAIGGARGFELNFLGLVTGVTPDLAGIKVPGFGTLRLLG